ncbi:MAG: PadR family transcriptional regulator [Microbispora sp.]|nr:PadR family transcriptional regulator [Microbispora sp.]
MTTRPPRRSALALTTLLLLHETPLHPYGLRQLIREWDKDRVVNVEPPNVIYQTIERLERAGLIAVKEVTRSENRPERTVYETTPKGVEIARTWLLDMLSSQKEEYPEFPAALSFLGSLSPELVSSTLEHRADGIQQAVESLDEAVATKVATIPGGVPRIYLIEIEYIQAMRRAELAWLRGVVDDIKSARLTWTPPN